MHSREPPLEEARDSRTGVGHVDVRIGAVGDQRVGVLQHLLRDVGMQVQAGHDRNVGADHGAHPRQQLAFTIVEVLRHHGSVQIQIDGVDFPG